MPQAVLSRICEQRQPPILGAYMGAPSNSLDKPNLRLVVTTGRAHGVLFMHTLCDLIVPASGQAWVNLLPAIVPLTRLVDTDKV